MWGKKAQISIYIKNGLIKTKLQCGEIWFIKVQNMLKTLWTFNIETHSLNFAKGTVDLQEREMWLCSNSFYKIRFFSRKGSRNLLENDNRTKRWFQ